MKTNMRKFFALALAILLCSFNTANATTYPVTNLNDVGSGSLRQAILDANANPGTDVITFSAGVTGTITLTTGQLTISDAVSIMGPGANLLSVQNTAGSNRVFYIGNTVTATFSGLTISGGSGVDGGGIYNYGMLTVSRSA